MAMDRRQFVLNAGMAGILGWNPSLLLHLASSATVASPFPKIPEFALPSAALYESDQDSYWTELRKQFLIPADEVYLNNGTVGSSPRPVLNAIFEGYNTTEKMADADPEDYPFWGYAAWNRFRDPPAECRGARLDETTPLGTVSDAK